MTYHLQDISKFETGSDNSKRSGKYKACLAPNIPQKYFGSNWFYELFKTNRLHDISKKGKPDMTS